MSCHHTDCEREETVGRLLFDRPDYDQPTEVARICGHCVGDVARFIHGGDR